MGETPPYATRVPNAVTDDAAPFADFHTLTAELRSLRADIEILRSELAEIRALITARYSLDGHAGKYWVYMPAIQTGVDPQP